METEIAGMRKVDLELKHGNLQPTKAQSKANHNRQTDLMDRIMDLFKQLRDDFPRFVGIVMMKSHFSECFLRTSVAFPIDKEWCKELQEATLNALSSLKQAIQTAIHTKIVNQNSLLESVHPEAFKATLERSEISSFLLECVREEIISGKQQLEMVALLEKRNKGELW